MSLTKHYRHGQINRDKMGEGNTLEGQQCIENFNWNICRGRPKSRWKDYIKKEIRYEGVDRLHRIQDND